MNCVRLPPEASGGAGHERGRRRPKVAPGLAIDRPLTIPVGRPDQGLAGARAVPIPHHIPVTPVLGPRLQVTGVLTPPVESSQLPREEGQSRPALQITICTGGQLDRRCLAPAQCSCHEDRSTNQTASSHHNTLPPDHSPCNRHAQGLIHSQHTRHLTPWCQTAPHVARRKHQITPAAAAACSRGKWRGIIAASVRSDTPPRARE